MIIGIAGKAGAGKDTLASLMEENLGFKRVAFAEALKDAAMHTFGLSKHQVEDREAKEAVVDCWGMSPRRLLQLFGTEAMKPVFGEDIWVRRLKQRINAMEATGLYSKFVISDVRFDEEAEAIIKWGGLVIEVLRPGSGLDGAAALHKSEAGISPTLVHATIVNSTTIGDLLHKIRRIMELEVIQG